MESIRILRIIARLNIGGPAIQAVCLSEALSTGPYRSLLVCGKVSPHEGDMSYLATSRGVEPLFLRGLGREISLFDDLRSFFILRRIVRRFKPDIVHTHTAKAGTLGRLAGLSVNLFRGGRRSIRLVHTFHGHVFKGYFSAAKTLLFILIERLLARFTDCIVAISSTQKREICEKYRIASAHRVQVIPLGFDLENFLDVSRYRTKAREEILRFEHREVFLVGMVGRLTPIKNHRMLLEAVRELDALSHSHLFRFLVVGDGEMREELEALARTLHVDHLVSFLGWRRDMPRTYAAMDVVVLTSNNEGTPVTLIEAMAAGVPVVATCVGGVPDLLGAAGGLPSRGYGLADYGIVIRPGDAAGLAEALLHVKENRDATLQTCARAREHVLAGYTEERLVRDLDALYRGLMGVRGRTMTGAGREGVHGA